MATGEGPAFGLALGAGIAIIAVGVATWGEPTAVGGLDTFVADDEVSEPLPHAATSTLKAADSNNRRINVTPRGDSDDGTQASYVTAPYSALSAQVCVFGVDVQV